MEQQITVTSPIDQAIVKTSEIGEMLSKLPELKKMSINGIEDKVGYKNVDAARKEVKSVRVLTTKICKDGREEAILVQKAWIAKEKEITVQFEEVEAILQAQIDKIDAEKQRIANEKAKADELRLQTRVKHLIDNGCAFDGLNYSINHLSISMPIIREMEDDDFSNFMYQVETEHTINLEAEEAARLEDRKISRIKRCEEIGMEWDEEYKCFNYNCKSGPFSLSIDTIVSEPDESFDSILTTYKKYISASKEAEAEELKRQQELLAKEKEDMRKEKLQLRGDKCLAAGLNYNQVTNGYMFVNKYLETEISADYIENTDNETFNTAISACKTNIDSAKEKQAEADKKEGERLQMISDRMKELANYGLVKDGINFKHPIHKHTTISGEILETVTGEEWSELIALLEDSIAAGEREVEEQKQREIQEKIDAGIKAEAERVEAARLKKISDDAAEQAERERQAALAPDKDKLQNFADALHNLVIPECNTPEGKKIAEDVKSLLLKIETHIVKNVKAL